ncbi:zf-CHY-domain-containing protein, partial [Cryphonectria parasitica EP155]
DEDLPELGCVHYKRNIKVQCAECDKWYTCRLCHDDAEEHTLPRKHTKNMLCMLCGHAQKASDTCAHCGESAASYYCNICKLWSDDVNKHIYHCDDCGICRVGRGLEKDFFHCKTCRACISIATKDDHKCIERATDANCPICNDDMFSSPQQVIFMECGHPIHRNCFQQYMNTSYKCPLCSKSIVKMDALFLNLANIIKEQPMPEEYRGIRSVLFCNDCSAKSSTDYHFLGLRCQICQSFNT